ncbi:putative integral membrane protein [Luteibacter sp. Sphag1AF]|uniref:hypothetical protein n=1 Tax=Luteibacter sp. Sphag1AF TaxID=2587031 RepID=UPI0016182513|nr:hypothetical protein [Luteibacter sp. Sphag1AF]MBB3227366.1 putative integral membrane protein [Luteibacter sp. Sphag1AF]
MSHEDWKLAWSEMDRRVDQQDAWLRALRDDRRTDVLGATLRSLRIGQWIQLVVGIFFAIVFGSFWVHHRDSVSLMLTGIFLHAYALSTILAAARTLYLIGTVDGTAPVLDTQRRLAALRSWKVREGWWFGVIGSVAWVPLLIWAFALGGVNLYAQNPVFVGWQVVAGLGCLGVFVLVMRYVRSGGKDGLERSAVARAQRALVDLDRFTKE